MGLSNSLNEDKPLAGGKKLPNFLSKNMRILRKRLGFSQQDLAEKVGLNRGNIASYEMGTAEPKICKLLTISKVLGVTTHDFTRLDFTQEDQLERAYHAFTEAEAASRSRINDRLAKTQEIHVVLDSVKNLYNFRKDKLDLAHPDVKALAHYCEQVQDLAADLLQAHESLLNELKCHCK